MEANEIMTNEEVIATAEDIAAADNFASGFKVAAGIGLVILTGGLAYRYIIKPMVAKIKAKKEQQEIESAIETFDDDIEAPEVD